mgnify:CR=1 FL=1
MKVIAMIPARYGATRFPAKLMQDLCGKPVIVHTYQRVKDTQLFDEVYVVTDDDRIEKAISEVGGRVIRSKKEHNSGSDRLAEASQDLPVDIIVNVQGDEPFTNKENLEKVIDIFAKDIDKTVDVASLMEVITDPEEIANPNNVKVVVNRQNEALYFSRSVIPYQRADVGAPYYKHIGIYAYRRDFLLAYARMAQTPLELSESLEQLRALENGHTIRVIETDAVFIGVDTEEDLAAVNEVYQKQGIH